MRNKRSRQLKTRKTKKIRQRGRGPQISKMLSSNNNDSAPRKAVSVDMSKRPTLRNRKELIDPERIALLQDLYDVRKEAHKQSHTPVKRSKKKVTFASKTKKGGRGKKSRKSKTRSKGN